MSVTDDISSQLMGKVGDRIRAAPGMTKNVLSEGKSLVSGMESGIVLVFKGGAFTTENLMSIAGKLSHNPKYSKQNISIAELEKNSDIKKIDDAIAKDVMKYFDAGCKKYGIKYSAVMDKSTKESTYYVFFKGKETSAIEQIIKEAYETYMKEQAKPRISVKAKLAFFLDRVKARDSQQQELGKERHNNRADRQR